MSCRQPLGTSEHRACIGLAFIKFTSCHCESKSSNFTQLHNTKNLKVKPALTNTKRKLPSWLSTSEPKAAEAVPEKKPRASHGQDMDLKVVMPVVEEGRKNSGGADLVEPEQGGSCNREQVKSQARIAGNDDTGDEPTSRSYLKRRGLDAKETGGNWTKKAKLGKGSPTTRQSHQIKPSETSQSEGNALDREKLVQGESSQRKLPLSREGKGKASREENQVLRDAQPGSMNGPERQFSKLLVGLLGKQTHQMLLKKHLVSFSLSWNTLH